MPEPINKYFGTPLSEWIIHIPNNLEVDAECLGDIILCGQDAFGLEGEELKEFVRKSVLALLQAGGSPVISHLGKWEKQIQYGILPEEIVENILKEWCVLLQGDPDKNGLWFALLK